LELDSRVRGNDMVGVARVTAFPRRSLASAVFAGATPW